MPEDVLTSAAAAAAAGPSSSASDAVAMASQGGDTSPSLQQLSSIKSEPQLR